MSTSSYILLTDIYSYGRGREQYGKVGDRVKLIGLHDDVLIVENSNGNRFQVHSKKVEKYVSEVIPVPAIEVKEQPVMMAVATKKQKRVFVNQTQLF